MRAFGCFGRAGLVLASVRDSAHGARLALANAIGCEAFGIEDRGYRVAALNIQVAGNLTNHAAARAVRQERAPRNRQEKRIADAVRFVRCNPEASARAVARAAGISPTTASRLQKAAVALAAVDRAIGAD